MPFRILSAQLPPEWVRGGEGSAREFTDSDGVRWSVYEADARNVPGARGERCLICDSESGRRRLWNYPAEWRDLPDQALAELCEHPVRPSAGRGSGDQVD